MFLPLFCATVATAILAFVLGFVSLLLNPKAKVVQLWFAVSMGMTIWAVGYSLTLLSNAEYAIYYIRTVYLGAIFVPILFLHFVFSFLFKINPAYKVFLVLGYAVALIFTVLLMTTPLVIAGVEYSASFGYYEKVSQPGFSLLLCYFGICVLASVLVLAKAFLREGGFRKRQIFYLLLAAIIGFGGGAFNFVSAVFNVYPYGQLLVWLYPILITIGIYFPNLKIKLVW